jgi:hypothetical protein
MHFSFDMLEYWNIVYDHIEKYVLNV